MKTTLAPVDANNRKIRTRTVKVDVERLGWDIKCAWCKVRPVNPVAEVIQHGFRVNLVQTVCYCAVCKLGTTVEWTCAAEEGETDVK